MMVVEDGLPYSGISTANAGTVGPVCSDVVTAAAAAAPPLQLDRTQQSMILEELTVSRQKLEEENQILRDELNEAKLVIRFLKFRLLQQEYQHEQEQQQQQTDENKNKSSRNLAGGATSDLDPHQRSILGVLQQHQQLQKRQQQQQQQQQQQFTGNSPPSNTTCLDPVHITALWSDLMQALDLAAEQKAAGVTTTMTRKNKKKKLTGTANESKRLLRHKAFRNPVASGQRLFGSHNNNNNNNKTTNQNKNNSRSNAAETSGGAAPKEGATLRSSSSSALWVEEWNNRNHPVLAAAAAADKGGKENKDVLLENGVPKEITMEVSVPPVTTITNTTTTTVVTPKSQSAPLSMIVEEQEDNDGEVELLLHRSTATTTTSLSSLSPPLGLCRSGSSPMTRSTKSALSHDQQQRRHCRDGARRSQSVPKLRHF